MIQKIVLLTLLGTLGAAVVIMGTHRSPSATPIEDALAFLADRDDIRWHEVEGRDIVICFRSTPDDLPAVVKKAAVRVSRTGEGEFHVYGVVKANRGWKPGSEPAAKFDAVGKGGQYIEPPDPAPGTN
jgi:hypothetical protein